MDSLSINKSTINYSKKSLLYKWFYFFNYYLISFVLLFSGISKIIDPQPLIETIKSLGMIDQNLVLLLATALPLLEVALAVMLLLKLKIKITLRLVATLFGFFFLFSLYGFTIGLESDCGCFGNTIKSDFGIGMIIRNFSLLLISIYLTINSNKNPVQGNTHLLIK